MVLARNQWKKTKYKLDWNATDTKWDQTTLNQVPLGIDPRQGKTTGYFVIPKEFFYKGKCFGTIQIAHVKNQ